MKDIVMNEEYNKLLITLNFFQTHALCGAGMSGFIIMIRSQCDLAS